MCPELEGELQAADRRIAVVVSRFNDLLTEHMLGAARTIWRRLGGREEDLTVVRVPGSLELPVTAKALAETGRHDAVVCLGCVIRGETDHYDHVVQQTARGIREVGSRLGVPCIFGVITADTLEQAVNRAGAKMGNQGAKAMMAGVEMANLMKKLGQCEKSDGQQATSAVAGGGGASGQGRRPGGSAGRRQVRCVAMQLLYQFDLTGDPGGAEVVEDFSEGAGCDESLALAGKAWGCRAAADALAGRLSPQWPSHRQPPIDRAIMRLAYHELASKRVPVGVAINEAVELAKTYGAENSAAFLNGLLDKMAKEIARAEG